MFSLSAGLWHHNATVAVDAGLYDILASKWANFAATAHPFWVTMLPLHIAQFLAFWIPGLLFLWADIHHGPAWLYQRKVQPLKLWEARLTPKILKNVVLNMTFAWPVVPVAGYLLSYGRFGIRVDSSLPTFGQLLLEVALCVLILEIGFYYIHLSFHRFFYRYHKIHHELTAPIGISAFYMHWTEFVGMAAAGMIGPMLINAHPLSAALFFAVGAWGGVMNHSGYRMPWTPETIRDPDYHDFHHEYFETNYSFLRIMDYIHGTNKPWIEYWHKRSKMDTKQT